MRHAGNGVALAGVIGGIILIIVGFLRLENESGLWFVTAGAAIVGAAATAFVLMRLALKIEANTSRSYSILHDLHALTAEFQRVLAAIERNTALSETTRSVAHRAREWEALREALYDQIRKEDFEAVFRLIDVLQSHPAYKHEADRLRAETRDECTDAFRKKAQQAVQHINGLLASHQWQQASGEIERLERLMPTEPRVKGLWDLLNRTREEFKQTLLRDWKKAVTDNNIERGLELLKELDQYLTPEEAQSAESTARELFRERLQQLGIQFQFAVNEKRWRDALAAGLQLIEEFPNSRMAGEIKDRLSPLRERAGIPSDVEVIARRDVAPETSDAATSET